MELFIKTMFWCGLVGFVVRCLVMSVRKWPHVRNESLGAYVAQTILSAAVTAWAASVLWLH